MNWDGVFSSEKAIRMCVINCGNFSNHSWRMMLSSMCFQPKRLLWTAKVEKATCLPSRCCWEVLSTVRSFKSQENCSFQHVELFLCRRMFWEVFYFLGEFVREDHFIVCVHNSLWGNSSIGEDVFGVVEPYSLSVYVKRWNTKSHGVMIFGWQEVLFGFHNECVVFEF